MTDHTNFADKVKEIQIFARQLENLTTGSVSRLAYSLRQECDELLTLAQDTDRTE